MHLKGFLCSHLFARMYVDMVYYTRAMCPSLPTMSIFLFSSILRKGCPAYELSDNLYSRLQEIQHICIIHNAKKVIMESNTAGCVAKRLLSQQHSFPALQILSTAHALSKIGEYFCIQPQYFTPIALKKSSSPKEFIFNVFAMAGILLGLFDSSVTIMPHSQIASTIIQGSAQGPGLFVSTFQQCLSYLDPTILNSLF